MAVPLSTSCTSLFPLEFFVVCLPRTTSAKVETMALCQWSWMRMQVKTGGAFGLRDSSSRTQKQGVMRMALSSRTQTCNRTRQVPHWKDAYHPTIERRLAVLETTASRGRHGLPLLPQRRSNTKSIHSLHLPLIVLVHFFQ
jgi:hypothetical protein